jgi:protocatechuate 3,4-dioxygenase beta subunit
VLFVVSMVRTVVVQLTMDNPLIWRHLRGRHPLADLEGPEYLLGAPRRARRLTSPEERAGGRSLLLCGGVFDRETGARIPGALVEIWQANPATGSYAWLSDSLRGKFLADPDGSYAIETVVPPVYRMPRIPGVMNRLALGLPHWLLQRLTGVDLWQERPPHVHLRVSAPGFRTLITQLYFRPVRPWLDHDVTMLAHAPREALQLELHAGGPDVECLARFDVRLDARAR